MLRQADVPRLPELPVLLTAALIRRQVLPIGRRTMQRYLARGEFPTPDMRINGKGYWRRETVLSWLAEHAPLRKTQEFVR